MGNMKYSSKRGSGKTTPAEPLLRADDASGSPLSATWQAEKSCWLLSLTPFLTFRYELLLPAFFLMQLDTLIANIFSVFF